MTMPLLQDATAFIWAEADMLDHLDYAGWLKLWTDDGHYIVPIDPHETDFFNSLNHANDDAEMRRLRVERLTGGESVSISPPPRTVRLISRVRVLSDGDGVVTVRCAQLLSAFRKDVVRCFAADLEYRLVRSSHGFKLCRKLVRLIDSDDAQVTVGFIF